MNEGENHLAEIWKRHHEQWASAQALLKKYVASVLAVFEGLRNTTLQEEHYRIDTKEVMSKEVVETVKEIHSIGKECYWTFIEEKFGENKVEPLPASTAKKKTTNIFLVR